MFAWRSPFLVKPLRCDVLTLMSSGDIIWHCLIDNFIVDIIDPEDQLRWNYYIEFADWEYEDE